MSDNGQPHGPDLQNVHGCLRELEDCSNGLASLDHLFGRVLDAVSEAERVWEAIEAEAARAAREDAPKAATATEIRGLITDYVNKRPSARKALDALREAENRKAKVERWMRSLEKRIGSAQAARNGHELLAKAGGSTAPWSKPVGQRAA